MSLTPEQKQTVATWVAAGDSLSVVQKKLIEHFKLSLTYMDVRFLVDDLGLELKNAAPKADASDVSKVPLAPARPAAGPDHAPGHAASTDDALLDETLADEADGGEGLPPDEFADGNAADGLPVPPAGAANVILDVDRIVRPGSVVSGTVTFTDGVSGKWALDQYGRLMLETGQKGYQPNPADVQSFQRQLQAQLQRQGF